MILPKRPPLFANRTRRFAVLLLTLLLLTGLAAAEAQAWGSNGHHWIRTWAADRLPDDQRAYIGQAHLDNLATDYTRLQDHHAGGDRPDLDPYCVVPGGPIRLHDTNPPRRTLEGVRWYLQQIVKHLRAGETDEAMKFLGVLCHWCEDIGSLSAHSSPVDEATLRQLVPPEPGYEGRLYLYGDGWIGLEANVGLEDESYTPRLLGRTIDEAAAQITRMQYQLERFASQRIVQAVIGKMEDDRQRFDEAVGSTIRYNAELISDVMFTVTAIAMDEADRFDHAALRQQPLGGWLPERSGRPAQPYRVLGYLADKAIDPSAARNVHPLALHVAEGEPDRQQFEHGFSMGAPLRLDFQIATAGVYDRFTARVGIHPEAGGEGGVRFSVSVDGERVGDPVSMRSGDPAQTIRIPLPEQDLLDLTLETEPLEDSQGTHNLAVWAEPTLHRR